MKKSLKTKKPADDMLGLELMNDKLAYVLAEQGIRTRDDLADLATDELMELVEMEESDASDLIMEARKHWFE